MLFRNFYNEAQHFVTLGGLGFLNFGNSTTLRASGDNYNEGRQRSKKVCKALDYGGVASKTSDIGPPILSAFAACKSGGTGTIHRLEAREVKVSSSREARKVEKFFRQIYWSWLSSLLHKNM